MNEKNELTGLSTAVYYVVVGAGLCGVIALSVLVVSAAAWAVVTLLQI